MKPKVEQLVNQAHRDAQAVHIPGLVAWAEERKNGAISTLQAQFEAAILTDESSRVYAASRAYVSGYKKLAEEFSKTKSKVFDPQAFIAGIKKGKP